EINPNSLPLALVCFIPSILLLSAEQRKRWSWSLLIAPLVFVALYTGRCTIETMRGRTFSVVPFDGFASISVSLQFADPEMVELFEDSGERAFVAEMMKEPCRTKRRSAECPESTAYLFEMRAYGRVFGAGTTVEMNRLFKSVSSRLLRQPKVFFRWQV